MIKSFLKKILFLKNLPKTLYVNFRALPFRTACKLPVYCGSHTTIRGLKKGSILLDSPNIHMGMVAIGVEAIKGSMLGDKKRKQSYINFSPGSKLTCRGKCGFASGNTVVFGKGAELILGDNFSTNVLCNFFVYKKIEFGYDCFCGWNVSVRDGDGHYIIDEETGEPLNYPKEIHIGNHCWLCSDATIMKGVSVADNCVIACNSLVLKPCPEAHAVYGGSPARLLKRNISIIRDGHGYGTSKEQGTIA